MILDLILLIIIILSVYTGYKKGFIVMLASFIGKFVALTISYFYYEPFKKFLIDFTGIDSYVSDKIKISLSNLGGHAAQSTVASSDLTAVSKMPLPDSIKVKLMDYLTESANTLGKSVATSLTDFIMTIIAFFLLFIFIMLFISILVRTLNLIAKLPVLNTFNKLGGIFFSLVTTYILLTVAFLIITSFISMETTSSLNEMLNNSVLAKRLLVYNPILIGLANIHL